MIDKRLMKEMPEAMKPIWKQVLVQWLSLLCNIGFVMLIAQLVTKVFENTIVLNDLWVMSGCSIVLILLRMIFSKLSSIYAFAASCDVKDQLRKRLYEKILMMKNSYQDYIATSELIQLNVEGIDQLETYFGRYLPQFFYSMLAPLTLFFVLIWMDVKSALVLIVCVPLIPLSTVAVQRFAKKLLSKYWSSYASLGDSFLENLQGLTTLKIYQADVYKNQEMNKEAEHFRKITMKVLTMQLNSVSVMDIIAYGGASIGSIVAINSYMHGNVSLFGVICIVLLSAEFFIPLRLLGSFFHIAMNGIAASGKIFRILDMPLKDAGTEVFHESELDMKWEHVDFSYDDTREILHDISLNVKPNQFVGIVGESGSGKSTIAKIMTGFAKQYRGSIQMQGIERSNINESSFYDRVVYVTHKPTIFKGTIRDNLRINDMVLTDEACWNVLEMTCLKAFVEEQGGLDMQVLESGNNLSGGQKQRLSLARALLADREMYIFDEATSNIDIESEEAILNVISKLSNKKTVIMITHRLQNVVNSDQIYVMQKGCCVETGTHQELLDAQNQYYEMYIKQSELEHLKGGIAYA